MAKLLKAVNYNVKRRKIKADILTTTEELNQVIADTSPGTATLFLNYLAIANLESPVFEDEILAKLLDLSTKTVQKYRLMLTKKGYFSKNTSIVDKVKTVTCYLGKEEVAQHKRHTEYANNQIIVDKLNKLKLIEEDNDE